MGREAIAAAWRVILALRAVRLIVRLRTSRPPNATTGYPLLDRLVPRSIQPSWRMPRWRRLLPAS